MNVSKYFSPETLEEACSLLSNYKDKARVIAGGTDLVMQMKQGEVLPGYIINIANIAGQDYITHDEKEGLKLGAMATMRSIATSPLIQQRFNVLAQAAGKVGTWQVQNRATIGGNICNAATSADTIPALLVLGAGIRILSADGERTVPLENFFVGPGQTVLKYSELVTEIQVPNLPPRSGGVYIKHTIRKALDLAIIGVAALATVDGDTLSQVKIALGTAAPTPIRALQAESVLRGKKISDELIDKAAQAALDESSPRDSMRSSAEYRSKIIKVLVARAVKQAIEQARAG